MRNHIAIKFIAICLCALFLMTSVGSAVGIVMLASADLYNHTVQDVYQEHFRNVREGFADSLVFRLASMDLGGCSSVLVDQYYDTDWFYNGPFRYGSFAYTVEDAKGNQVDYSDSQELPGALEYVIPVKNGSYLRVVPEDQVPKSLLEPEDAPLNVFPPAPTEAPTEPPTEPPTEAPTEAPTEVPAETGLPVGTEASEPEAEQPEAETDAETAGETMPRMAAFSLSAEDQSRAEPRISTIEEYQNAFPYEYYDYMQDETVRVYLCYSNTSDYTVHLYLQPDALDDYQSWVFLSYIWNYRNQLFLVLGVSLLIFAAFAVYLCCAAGRKPGSAEVRPTAVNRTPLDLYALITGGVIVVLLLFNWELQYLLIKRSLLLATTTAAASCFVSSLLVVGFGFAFAAQVKTPGGFWWRHSVLGNLLLGLRWLGRSAWQLCLRLCRKAPGFFRRIGGGFRKIARWIGAQIRRFFAMIGRILRKFTGLLPLMWQWLLAMGIVIFDLALTISTGSLSFIALGILFCLAITVYGACSFGTLLDTARRMHQGDLETKVDDKYLVGCFQSFAEELNGIADVAMVATQKQLKSERMKTELITNVSHDIKTPLTSIINYVDLLSRPHTEQEQTAWLEVLARQSASLKKLIDDLMEMSKAASGTLTVDITTVDASEAVSQALGEFSDKLEKAQLTPVFRQSDKVVNMQADGRLAWRVMSNLLGNAVKYALPGTRLYVDLMELDGKVLISMKNISREQLNVCSDELLERFVRGDASRNTEGSGLGLNIAKTLMELQHGQLELLVDGDLFKVTLIFPAA